MFVNSSIYIIKRLKKFSSNSYLNKKTLVPNFMYNVTLQCQMQFVVHCAIVQDYDICTCMFQSTFQNATCFISVNKRIDLLEINGNRFEQRKSTHPRFRVYKYDVFTTRFYI